MPTVYLCGAMEGLSQLQASLWRSKATQFYKAYGIKVLDPCRRTKFHDQTATQNLAQRIVALDLIDIDRCDLVLANLKDRGSGLAWGSVMEIALAKEKGKPIITVLEATLVHPFISTFSTELHDHMDDALDSSLEYFK